MQEKELFISTLKFDKLFSQSKKAVIEYKRYKLFICESESLCSMLYNNGIVIHHISTMMMHYLPRSMVDVHMCKDILHIHMIFKISLK